MQPQKFSRTHEGVGPVSNLSVYMTNVATSVAVIGAGTMGTGIAQVAATAGCEVRLIELNATVLDRAVQNIRSNLQRSVEKGKIEASIAAGIVDRIHPMNAIKGLHGVSLAIEAVVESIDVKHKVFRELEQSSGDTAIFASNTSSLSIDKIAEAVRDPSRVIGLHFFNPAPLMPLVEVIAGQRSNPAAMELGRATVTAWGKVAVRAKDTPGFIVNRVARGYYLEALRLLGEGVAGIDEIDGIMRKHAGFKMGPFELMDLVGLDVNLAVSTSVWEQMDKPARLTPHDIQRKLVSENRFGRKTNRGFYAYQDGTTLPAVSVDRRSFRLSPSLADAARVFCEKAGIPDAGSTEHYVVARILSAIINEAGLAYVDGVATSDDIDLAMVKGTNYPKGPLAWADEIGFRNVRGVLKALNDQTGDGRYEPAKLFADAT